MDSSGSGAGNLSSTCVGKGQGGGLQGGGGISGPPLPPDSFNRGNGGGGNGGGPRLPTSDIYSHAVISGIHGSFGQPKLPKRSKLFRGQLFGRPGDPGVVKYLALTGALAAVIAGVGLEAHALGKERDSVQRVASMNAKLKEFWTPEHKIAGAESKNEPGLEAE